MKKFFVTLAVFAAVFLLVSCGGTENFSNNNNEAINNGDNDEENTAENSEGADTYSNNDYDFSDSSVSDESEQPDNSDSGEEEQYKQGDLYGECYPNETCNKGLICDIEYNICIKDPDSSNENNDPKEDPCKNNPCSGISNSTGVCKSNGTSYSCGCYENYSWNGSYCKADSRTVNCTGLPANAKWNTASSITQTWNGYAWYPSSTTGTYNKTPSTEECRFICKDNYTWNYTECIANTQTADCTNLPKNAEWNSVSSITQTWNGYAWYPSSIGSYNESASTEECRFTCHPPFNWTGSACALNSSGSSISIGKICTGQNKCYDNKGEITCPSSPSDDFYGQDAQYTSKCIKQSFTVGEGIVVDNNTGLTWEKSPPTGSSCSSSNYAGINEWRLPNPLELLSIVDNSRSLPAVDTSVFDYPNNYSMVVTAKQYPGEDVAYCATTYTGSVGKGGYNYLITHCVYGPELQKGSFLETTYSIDNEDNTVVIDLTTGLMWQTEYVRGKTWQQALKHCEDLTYAGFNDWRLPNKNELASLLNYDKKSWPFTDFLNSSPFDFWSSSSLAYDTGAGIGRYAWDVQSNGTTTYTIKTDTLPTICVRNAE